MDQPTARLKTVGRPATSLQGNGETHLPDAWPAADAA